MRGMNYTSAVAVSSLNSLFKTAHNNMEVGLNCGPGSQSHCIYKLYGVQWNIWPQHLLAST